MTELADLADRFLKACAAKKILSATAESCTGGLIIATLTDIPGSSSMVDRGFVTYSNEAKMEMLGVAKATLDAHGAVSRQTALEMAAGALKNSRAGITLAVTGIAGPDGGSIEKPVGLVWFGLALAGQDPVAEKRIFDNNGRDYIRRQTVLTALEMGLKALEG
ncbi:CinA family protein [Mesorhizobium sp. LHD-90]|uniref:CinA family protein n=1 Tax=Mesorhizobium sp. LHD-90 TaxID=3071414 RepID=UPI0027E1A59D|nr:CinA family protein [Mesorhizobium sp. LHD-90]MDQ6437723.1 CinA family protein [Mesorhizobium sp. LHD-90]